MILISAKPFSILTHVDSYYPPNKSTEFYCEVISNPPPNITWSFLRCPNYPSLEDSTIVYLTVNIILLNIGETRAGCYMGLIVKKLIV